MQSNKGFITEIVLIIVALIVLYALGFNFQNFLHTNLVESIVSTVRNGWNALWTHGLGKIIIFAWDNGLTLWHTGWNGLLQILEKISALIPSK